MREAFLALASLTFQVTFPPRRGNEWMNRTWTDSPPTFIVLLMNGLCLTYKDVAESQPRNNRRYATNLHYLAFLYYFSLRLRLYFWYYLRQDPSFLVFATYRCAQRLYLVTSDRFDQHHRQLGFCTCIIGTQ